MTLHPDDDPIMSITFRKFTASARLSEETVAYATDVLWKGKRIGHCRNDGRGGMGVFHRAEGARPEDVEAAQAWAKTQHYQDIGGDPVLFDGQVMGFDRIEDYCDYLAGREMEEKQLRQQLRRALKSRVVFEDPDQGPGLFEIKQAFHASLMPALLKRHPRAVVLNSLPPEQALERFRAEAVRVDRQERQATASRKSAPTP